ncbi:MAG: hypothetical protein U1F06_03610 [Steroidobacteraceae bacterium]
MAWLQCEQLGEFADVARLLAQRVEDPEPQRLGQRAEVVGHVGQRPFIQ